MRYFLFLVFFATACCFVPNSGSACDPSNWHTTQLIPGNPLSEYFNLRWKRDYENSYHVTVDLIFDSSAPAWSDDGFLLQYDGTYFMDWYNANSIDTGSLTITTESMASGKDSVPISFVWSGWTDYNAWGEPTTAYCGWQASVKTGYLASAPIEYNWGDYPLDMHTNAGIGKLANLLAHEVGHAIGMGHGDEIMDPTYDGMTTWSATETNDVECVYPSTTSGAAPAYFGSVMWFYEDGVGVELNVQTVYEDGVTQISVLRGQDGETDFESYFYAGAISLQSPTGAMYEFVDRDGTEQSSYLLKCIGEDGDIENIIYLPREATPPFLVYEEDTIDEMRNYSLDSMRSNYWKRIFSGEEVVTPVPERASVGCDYLVICFPDFASDISPICDYWETQGIDVALHTCDGREVEARRVRDSIYDAYSLGTLDAVWLIGSTLPYENYTDLCPNAFSLVPTFYPDGDFLYSDIDYDGIIEVPVGRLPARSADEVAYYVCKELRYHREVSWGGKKDPRTYGTVQVFCATDETVSDGLPFTADQETVKQTSYSVADILESQLGNNRVDYFSTDELPAYELGDHWSYVDQIYNAFNQRLEDGRHVVFGASLHNATADLFGVIPGWVLQQMGISVPWGAEPRECDTFWIAPMCHSNSLWANIRYSDAEPEYLQSQTFPVYELFLNRGLLILGSCGVTWHDVTHEVSTRVASRLFVDDAESGHSPSVGSVWMEVHNELVRGSAADLRGVNSYSIYGDPMLYVRDVYSDAAVAEPSAIVPFAVTGGPNPFNGIVEFAVTGVSGNDSRLRIYDVRGRLVKDFALKDVDAQTIKWAAKDNSGRGVSSGAYFAVVNGPRGRRVSKVMYVK